MYRGERRKIGTCEDMLYLRFDQRYLVKAKPGNVDPARDVKELRFRFPFPDEDSIQPGDFDEPDRSIEVLGFAVPDDYHITVPPLRIVQQKYVDCGDWYELQTVVRDSCDPHFGSLFRLTLEQAVRCAESLLVEAHMGGYDADGHLRDVFFGQMAKRVMAGYKENPQWVAIQKLVR